MLKLLLIAVGGALGSLLRYFVQGWAQRSTGDWAARLAGDFSHRHAGRERHRLLAIGLISGYFAGPQLIREEYRIGLTIGVLGGYSTFSTFGFESFNLANAGDFGLALLNMVLSCAIGFIAVWIGYRVAERSSEFNP